MQVQILPPQPPMLAISAQATPKGRLSRFGRHFAKIGCCASPQPNLSTVRDETARRVGWDRSRRFRLGLFFSSLPARSVKGSLRKSAMRFWAPADVKKAPSRAAEHASDRFRSRLTGGRIPLVKLSYQLDQLLKQRGRVIFAVAHNDR